MLLSELLVIKEKKKCLLHIISSPGCTLKSILAIPRWHRQIPILKNNSLNIIKKPLFKSDNFHVEADMEMAFLEQSWFALLGVIAHDSLLRSPLVWIFHNPHSRRRPPLCEVVVHRTGRSNFNEASLLSYQSRTSLLELFIWQAPGCNFVIIALC